MRTLSRITFVVLSLLSLHTTAFTTLVVPAFNEEKRLPLEELVEFSKITGRRILIVDDGSADNTYSIVKSKENLPLFTILRLEKNSGKGEAVRLGMLKALEQEGVTFVGFWDADLATPLSALKDFQAIFERFPAIEMVFGSRVALLGRNIKRHASRHYLGRIFATLASTLLNLRIYDTQCGSKLFRVTEDLKVVLSEPFMSRWIFDVELIARFALLKRNKTNPDILPIEQVIYEYPLHTWEDVEGSKVNFKDKIRALEGLFQIWYRYYSPDWLVSKKPWPPVVDAACAAE